MSTFQASHVTRTHSITLSGPPERIFPLFSPLGEKAWAEGWDPEIIYPPSGAPQVGTVFTIAHAGGVRAVWTITDYDPAHHRIAYVLIVPEARVCRIEVQCQAADGRTQVNVAYTHTALTSEGNAYIATQTDEFHRHRIDSWKTAIDHYLAHGHAVPHH